MNKVAAIWILILFLICLLICGICGIGSGNVQYKFFALGGIATMGYLLILSFFD